MNKNRQIYKRNSRLFLTLAICLVLALCGIALCFNIEQQHTNDVYAATSTATFSMPTVKKFDSDKGRDQDTNINTDTLAFSRFTSTSNHITGSMSGNTATITTKSNLHFEAGYADVVASITVPAWHEYKITYTVNITLSRANDIAGGGSGCEVFDFNSDVIKGESASLVFNTSTSAAQTVSEYSKRALYADLSGLVSTDSYTTATITYSNNSNDEKTYKRNFGVFAYCRATTGNNTNAKGDFEFSSEVQSDKLLKPTDDTTKYTYNADEQTYSPVGWVASDMELTSDSDSMTQTNAGTYNIKVKPSGDYTWTDGTTDEIAFTFTINKAKPNPEPQYEDKADRYISEGLPTLTNKAGGVAGTFSWGTQSPVLGSKEYTWTFTPSPENINNYETQTGKITLNYVTPGIKSLSAKVKDGDIVYDAYDFTEVKKHIEVTVTYVDNTTKTLSSADYEVSTTSGKLTAGEESEITIRLVADNSKYKPKIEVTKSEVEGLDAYMQSGATFTYPITAEDILAKFDVETDWNYSNVPVNITDKSVLEIESDDPIAAGSYTFKIKYKGTDVTSDPLTITIQKGTYNMSGVSFVDDTVKYDGNPHSLAITGTLPDGVTVSYEGNGETNFGKYTVTAKFTGDANNYNSIPDKTAQLKIEKGDYVLEGITFENANFPYDGETHSLAITGDLPDWISVDYFDSDENKFEGATEIGSYKVIAKFTHSDNNYNEIKPMTATLVIGQSGYNVQFEFNDKSVVFNGKAQTIGLTGEVPDWITVEFVDEDGNTFAGAINVGEYKVTAKFTHENELYTPIENMTATLTITKAELEIIQGAKDFTYDGSVKGGEFTVKNYDADKIVKKYYKGNEIKEDESNKLKDNELPKNAGEYIVVLSIAEEDKENCSIKVGQTEFKITIAKAQITAIWNSDSEIPTLKGLSEDEVDVVEYVFTDEDGIVYKQSELQAGMTYKVKAVIADGYENNYEFIDKKGDVLDDPTMTDEQPFKTKDEPIVTEDPKTGFDFSKIIEMLQSYWQPILCAICSILIIIFMSKGIGYAGKRKKIKKTMDKKYSTAYYAVGGVGLFGLPYATWTLVACIVAGVTVLAFIFMILQKRMLSKTEEDLEDAKEEYAKTQKDAESKQMQMMLMGMLGGNANGQNGGGQSFVYQQPSLGADDIRGIVADTMNNMLPNVTQYLPQEASHSDELIQQLIEQNAENEERMRQMNAQNEERMQRMMQQLAEQNNKNNVSEDTIERLVEKLSSQRLIESVAEKEVAATNANDEIIKSLIEGQKAIMEKLSRQDEDKQVVKVVEKDSKDEKIEMLMRNQEMLMKQMMEMSSRSNDKQVLMPYMPQPIMTQPIIQQPTEKVVEKIVEKPVEKFIPVPVEKIVEKEVVKEVPVPMPIEKPTKEAKAPAQRLTLDEAYAKLSATQKKIFDTLKAYAMSKDKCKEKKSTYFTVLGQSTVNPLVKLTIKKNTTVAMFKMEDEYFKDIRRNAGSDGTKMKVKETELVVGDNQALATAKDMIDLREDQIERYNDYLKEQRSMKKK